MQCVDNMPHVFLSWWPAWETRHCPEEKPKLRKIKSACAELFCLCEMCWHSLIFTTRGLLWTFVRRRSRLRPQGRCSAARASCCRWGRDTRCRPRWGASPPCRAAPAGPPRASPRRSTSSTWEDMLQRDQAASRLTWVTLRERSELGSHIVYHRN